MANRFFTKPQIAVLADPSRWRFVASGLPWEVQPCTSNAHTAWARRHAHAHSHREILVVLSGKGYQSHSGRSFPVRSGAVFLYDANEPHDYRYPPSRSPVTHLWLYFMHHECGGSLMRVSKDRRQDRHAWQKWGPLRDLGLPSTDPLFPSKPGAPAPTEGGNEEATVAVRARCAGALGLLVNSLIEAGFDPPPEKGEEENFQADIVHTMQRHIQETHGRDCRLETLARVAGYSKFHFSRLFQEHTGTTLQECVNRARTLGFEEMKGKGLPLKTISAELGFRHPSALCRWRRQQGI